MEFLSMAQSQKSRQGKSFYELSWFLLLYSMSCPSLSESYKGVIPDKYRTLSHTHEYWPNTSLLKAIYSTRNAVGVLPPGHL